MPSSAIENIALYCTSPVKRILAAVKVADTISDNLNKLWEITNSGGAISKDTFDSYFNGLVIGHAFKLGEAKLLNNPLPLNAINQSLKHPPQSFRYLSGAESAIIFDQI
ncbi:MAG: hypothetical protein LBK52_05015 [Deltaproteobacteria bacterium]|nr:hypothetical protein [Deltaproteobacteria bacterium]